MTQADGFRSGGFAVSTYRKGEAIVVQASGELDVVTTPTLASHLDNALAQGLEVVIVDLAAVEFMSSAGLNLLVNAHRLLEPTTVSLRVAADSPATVRPIRVTGTDKILDLYPSVNAALLGRQA